MSDNDGYYNAADISRLTVARQAAHDLAQMQRAARELPELEAKEQERQRKAQAKERGEQAAGRLDKLANNYRLALNRSNLEILELAKSVSDIIRRRKKVDTKGEEVAKLAQQVAQTRIELGGAPGGGSWGHSPNENRLLLQSVTEQVLSEHSVGIGVIEPKNDDDTTRRLLAFLGQFCTVKMAPKPQDITAGRVLIVGHSGEQHWG